MSIGRLIVELEARTGKFETDTGRAAKIMEKRAREIEAQAKRISNAIGAAIGVAAIGAAASLAALTKKAIDTADEFSKLSQKTGLTTEAISALDFAGKQSGVDDLAGSLVKLNRAIVEAQQGSKEQAGAFDAIGVSVTDAEGKLRGTEEVLRDIANAFARFEDGPAKTAVAMDIFGKSGAELIPLLNGGSEGLDKFANRARELGLIIDGQTGKASEAFNDNLSELKLGLEGVGRSVAKEVAPRLLDLSKIVADPAFAAGLKRITEAAISATESVARLVARIGTATSGRELEKLQREAAFLQQTIDKRTSGRGFLEGIGRDVDAELADLQTRLQTVNAEIENLTAGKMDAALLAEAEALERAGTAAAKAAPGVLNYAGAADRAEASTRRAAKATSQWDDLLELHKKIASEDAERQELLNSKISEAARIFDNTRMPLERFNAEIERLNELRDTFVDGKPLIDAETYTRAVQQVQDQLTGLAKKTEDTTDDMTKFADQAARNMQDAFADFLFDPFSRGLDGMLEDFANTLQRMAANKAAAEIFNLDWSGIGGSVVSGALSLFGGVPGVSPTGIKEMDSGGRGVAGEPYFIGTGAQPELFIPDTAGTFVPRDQWMGGGAPNVTINIPITAPTGTVGRQTLDQISSAALSGASRALRRNG